MLSFIAKWSSLNHALYILLKLHKFWSHILLEYLKDLWKIIIDEGFFFIFCHPNHNTHLLCSHSYTIITNNNSSFPFPTVLGYLYSIFHLWICLFYLKIESYNICHFCVCLLFLSIMFSEVIHVAAFHFFFLTLNNSYLWPHRPTIPVFRRLRQDDCGAGEVAQVVECLPSKIVSLKPTWTTR
jgi:hypothetical protein